MNFLTNPIVSEGFPGGSMVKNPPANAGDTGMIPGSGKFHGEDMFKTRLIGIMFFSPLKHSSIPLTEKPSRLIVHGVAKLSN